MSMHYHKCPECFEKYNCDQDCTLQDAGNSLGANVVCALCENEDKPTPTAPEPSMTPEQWARYNGFIR